MRVFLRRPFDGPSTGLSVLANAREVPGTHTEVKEEMSLTPYTRELGPVFDRWFESPFRGWDRRPSSPVFPPVDAYSDDEGLVVRLEVPGIPPESLSIETRERVLVIKAEAPEEEEGAYRHRAFTRSFRLPADVDPERAEAKHEHGVLVVRIPKSEAVKPRQIEVKIH